MFVDGWGIFRFSNQDFGNVGECLDEAFSYLMFSEGVVDSFALKGEFFFSSCNGFRETGHFIGKSFICQALCNPISRL